jgi:selenocysteine lyase/cysteine desulfurase
LAEVRIIEPDQDGLVCLDHFARLLEENKDRKLKIAAVTSCSNVTGLFTPYHEIAKMIHEVGGYCFVDFACSAPYVDINMHPQETGTHLDAIYF